MKNTIKVGNKDVISRNDREVVVTSSKLHLTGLAFEVRSVCPHTGRGMGVEGYDVKYVAPYDPNSPGAVGNPVSLQILSDLERKAHQLGRNRNGKVFKLVYFGLFKDLPTTDGRPARVWLQVADVHGKWIARHQPWSAADFTYGSRVSRQILESFLERPFAFNEGELTKLYRSSTLREFHEMTAPDNQRIRALYLEHLQAEDVLGDTPLNQSNLVRGRTQGAKALGMLGVVEPAESVGETAAQLDRRPETVSPTTPRNSKFRRMVPTN